MIAGKPDKAENFDTFTVDDFEISIDKSLDVDENVNIDVEKFLFYERIILNGINVKDTY